MFNSKLSDLVKQSQNSKFSICNSDVCNKQFLITFFIICFFRKMLDNNEKFLLAD